jgi:hypothetical protein
MASFLSCVLLRRLSNQSIGLSAFTLTVASRRAIDCATREIADLLALIDRLCPE